MNRIKSVLVIGSFFTASLVNGQALVFSGKIIDKETSEPIPFAHIFTKDTRYGTTSNLYGVFDISLPGFINQLEVTCLGYKPITISILNQTDPIVVQLEEDIIELNEVVVRPRSAESLMKEAFDRLFINYDTSAFALSGRYKMVSVFDSLLVRSIEAELDLCKARLDLAVSYKVLPNDSIYIGQLRMINSEFDDYKLKAMVDWENTP
ncbi:MAG: carboxypeptidase-like regulatory domain-containing protein, partial [Bacteroidota bacterium]